MLNKVLKCTDFVNCFVLQLSSPISRTRILDVIRYPSFSQSHMSIYNHPKNKVCVAFFRLSGLVMKFVFFSGTLCQ